MKTKKIIDPITLQERDFTLSFVNGCFDGFLHPGRIQFLQFAKEKSDKLAVAVNSDQYIINHKNKQPIFTLDERLFILSSLECVDFVFSFDESTAEESIKLIKPDCYIKGPDHNDNEGVEFAKSIFYFKQEYPKHSSDIIFDIVKFHNY